MSTPQSEVNQELFRHGNALEQVYNASEIAANYAIDKERFNLP